MNIYNSVTKKLRRGIPTSLHLQNELALSRLEAEKVATFQTWTPRKPYRHMTEIHSGGSIEYYVDGAIVNKEQYDEAWK